MARQLILFLTALCLLFCVTSGDVTVSTCAELKEAAGGDEPVILGADIELSASCNSISVKGSLMVSGGASRFAIDGLNLYGGAFVIGGSLAVARVTFRKIRGATLLSESAGNISVSNCLFDSVEQGILSPPSGGKAGVVVVTGTTFEGNDRCISALTATVTKSVFVANVIAGIESTPATESLKLASTISVQTSSFRQNLFRYAIVGPGLVVSNCTFEQNKGGAISGGGDTGLDNTLWVSNCNFTGNGNHSLTGGGVILVNSSDKDVYIAGSRFEENLSGGYGGAITFSGSPSAAERSIVHSVFYWNVARYGGAIASMEGLMLVNSTFVMNNATENGGAVFVQPDTSGDISLSISGSGFALNSADGSGGAIAVKSGGKVTVSVTRTAFARNIAGEHGASLSLQPDTIDLLSCTSIYVGNQTTDNLVYLAGSGTASFYPPLMPGTFNTLGGGSVEEASADSCTASG